MKQPMNTDHAANGEATDCERLAADNVYEQFQRIVQAYDQRLYRFACHLVESRQDAEDLVQETFLRAYNAIRAYPREKRDTLHISAWLYTIMKNTNLSYRGRQQAKGSYVATSLESLSSDMFSETDHAAAIVEADAIQQALVRVSPQYRACLTLQDICGLSQKEIAQALNITSGCVGAYVSRGRIQFRQAYQRAGDETGSQRCPGH